MRALILRIVLAVGAATAGCASPPGTASDAGGGGLDTGGADAGNVDASADDAAVADAGSDAGPGRVDAGVDAAASDASTADAPAALTVEIVGPSAYGSCFGGPPDPFLVFWTARVTGTPGATVVLDSAVVHVTNVSAGTTIDHAVTVDVPSFPIPASGTVDTDQRKISGMPSVPICSWCSDTLAATLEVTYHVAPSGPMAMATATVSDIGCVF